MDLNLESDNYKIVVAEVDGTKIYHVVNKTTDVVEVDDYILSRTIEALFQLEDKLDEATELYRSRKVKPLEAIH